MMPFLVPDLLKLVKDLLARFVQRAVVESLVTCSDVIGFDTNDIGKHCPAIELGFSADKITRSDNFKKKKVIDRDMLGIRTDAKSGLKAMCKKLLQKTPITYPVARACPAWILVTWLVLQSNVRNDEAFVVSVC